jgi:DnaJ-class molecular chaperone
LILGVRESAAKAKVLEAHRRVMMANHPDAGGSAFLSTKINEAKTLLVSGKRGSGTSGL